LRGAKHGVDQIALAPVVDQQHDERQQAQTIVRRQHRHAEQVAEADQHKEVLEAAALRVGRRT